MTVRNLQGEVAAFLDAQGPSTSPVIAAGVRARRQAVDEALLAGLFQQAATPEGGNPRARYWVAASDSSPAVPLSGVGHGRAALMLAVLSDGRKHSRAEIFRKAGQFFLTNNAAAELRAKGHNVCHTRDGNVSVYWLEAAQQATVAHRARKAVSVSAPASFEAEVA